MAAPASLYPGSRTPHGVRGLKYPVLRFLIGIPGRTPHGVRGLKLMKTVLSSRHVQSHPSRGAWIEIPTIFQALSRSASHPSRGAWIEILTVAPFSTICASRTPHGVRGLKYVSIIHRSQIRCRTPHGVRGLKYPLARTRVTRGVAPLTGCVD